MKVLNRGIWQDLLVILATKFVLVATLLSKFWRKRLLAKIATKRIHKGQITVPQKLLNSLNNKRIADVKKSNLLSYKSKILTKTVTSFYKLPSLKEGHNKSLLLVVHNSLPYDAAGYAHRTMHEAKAYQSLGYAVSIVTRQGYPWDLAKHQVVSFKASQIVEGIEIFTITGTRKYKVDSDLKYAIEYGRQVAALAQSLNAGFIQASSNYINGLAGYVASRKSGIPFIYEARGMWHVTRASKEKKFKKTELYAYEEEIERWVLNNASANIFITKIMRDKYHGNKLIPTAILQNCITINKNIINHSLSEATSISPFKLLYAGSLVFYEGLEELIEVVGQLASESITLDIYGDGPYKNEIVEKIKRLSSANVTYHGRISSECLRGVYENSHAVVVPRIDCDVTRMVPPLKPIEALLYSLPVLTSNLPAIKELTADLRGIKYTEVKNKELKKGILELRKSYSQYKKNAQLDAKYISKERTWKSEIKKCISNIVEEC